MNTPVKPAPTPDEMAMLALLAIHIAHDLERGDVKNAQEGAKIVRAYAFAIFAAAGGWEAFLIWGHDIAWGPRMRAAIAQLKAAPADVSVKPSSIAAFIATLESAIEAEAKATTEEARQRT